MKNFFVIALLSVLAGFSARALEIASHGRPRAVIVRESDATLAEQTAARELANYLQQITGATFQIQNAPATNPSGGVIIVGAGELAAEYFPEVNLADFGPEEFVMRTKGNRLLLAGGRPRGTLYAVEHFLQEQCGVRWWTPWATNVPRRASLKISNLDIHEKPVFEYREPFWSPAFDPLWKSRNGANGEHNPIPAELGGCLKYKGFAHTFYQLVPPENISPLIPNGSASSTASARTTARSFASRIQSCAILW